MKQTIYFLFLILIFSCKEKDENLDLKYEIINKLISENGKYHQMVKKNLGIHNSTGYFVINHNFSVLDENDWKIYSDSVQYVEPEIKIVVPPDDVIILSEDSIFSKKDIEYMKEQIEKNKKFKIDKSRITLPTEFISQSELDQILKRRSNYNEKEYVNFSVPLFNLKKDKCLNKSGILWNLSS